MKQTLSKSPDAPPVYQFYVYIYSKKNDKYYIGTTKNVVNRLATHNSGGSAYTRSYTPWELVRVEGFLTHSMARKRESEIKRKKSRRIIELIIADTETDDRKAGLTGGDRDPDSRSGIARDVGKRAQKK